MIAPGGGVSLDGQRWVSCRPGFFLPVRALSRLFRRLFLEQLMAAHGAGRLQFFGAHAALAARDTFSAFLNPLRATEWVVYAKRPFGGPEAVLAYQLLRGRRRMKGVPPAFTRRACSGASSASRKTWRTTSRSSAPSAHALPHRALGQECRGCEQTALG